MDLRQFYFNNIRDSEYHHRFFNFIKNVNQRYEYGVGFVNREDACLFEVFDIEETISKFKDLCQPRNNEYSPEEKCWFYLITYYLYKSGYYISEFPKLLERPPENPMEFTYTQIRDRIISEGYDDGGIVRWSTRRMFVSDLTFLSQRMPGGVHGTVKNIIFASRYKPEIVFDDALNNDIRITKNAEHCLIYDRTISNTGLKWSELVDWYAECQGITENQEGIFFQRLTDSMDSDPEKIVLRAYYSYIHERNTDLPALIPQVYLYYDPLTIQQRGYKMFEHQKMDFLMIFSHSNRVVIEIDGQQHYSESGKPSSRRYAEMVKAQREMSLLGYDVYRFGGYEFLDTQDVVISNIKSFFYNLFQKYDAIAKG